ISSLDDAVLDLTRHRARRERMELPKVSKAAASAADSGAALCKLLVQGVFLFTGVFSTCMAEFVFNQGTGDQARSSARRRSSRTSSRPARRCATN
ncbi:hypothetical protein PF007_g29158, partial [Phytophthora fragariae]